MKTLLEKLGEADVLALGIYKTDCIKAHIRFCHSNNLEYDLKKISKMSRDDIILLKNKHSKKQLRDLK